MATRSAPLNRREPFVDKEGFVRDPAYKWLRDVRDQQDDSPALETEVVELTAQTAAISTTAIPADSLSAGYYRVSVFLRVTTAAGTSGDVQVTIHYTRDGVSCSEVGTLLDANAVDVPQSNVFLVRSDGGSPISYSVAYNANPAASLVYELSIILERVSA